MHAVWPAPPNFSRPKHVSMRGVEIRHEIAATAPAKASPPRADAACRRRRSRTQMIEVSGGHFEARHLGDLGRRLADALRIDRPVRRDQQLAQRFVLRVVADVRLCALSRPTMRSRKRVFGHDGLLAGADGAVVERLAGDDLRRPHRPGRPMCPPAPARCPGPTPKAGLPLEYAAFTMPVPPVERITPVRSCRISALVPSMVALSTHWMMSSGAPASSAA